MTSGRLPERELLSDFVRMYPFQPATAYWRWFETDVILRSAPPTGFGLDLGCGDGQLTQLMADRVGGWRLVGLEPDPREIELARRQSVYQRLHAAPGDVIPEPDATFDFVFSNSVLEHIPDVRPVLREVRRVLKPGGQLIATVPGRDFHDCLAGPPWWWRLLFGASRDDYLAELDRRLAHFYYWGDEQWRNALRATGFTRVACTPYMQRDLVQRWERLTNCTSGILYKLTGARRRPIDIQRQMHLRGAGRKMPRVLLPALLALLGRGNRMDAGKPPRYGCLLLRASRD